LSNHRNFRVKTEWNFHGWAPRRRHLHGRDSGNTPL